MEDLEVFSYSGKKVIIRKGENFSKKELENRLSKMNINIENRNKSYLINQYDKAIAGERNKKKIFDELIKDTEFLHKIMPNKINFILDKDEERETPISYNREKNSKKLLIKNEIIDERNIDSLRNTKNKVNNIYKPNYKSDFTNILTNQITERNTNKSINAFQLNIQNNRINNNSNEEKKENRIYQPNSNLTNWPKIYLNPNNNINNSKTNRKDNTQIKYEINKKFFPSNNSIYVNNELGDYKNSINVNNDSVKKNEFIMINIMNEDSLKDYNNNDNSNYENKINIPKIRKIDLSQISDKNYNNQNDVRNKLFNNQRKDDLSNNKSKSNHNNNNSISIPVNHNNIHTNRRNRYRNFALEKIHETNLSEEEEENFFNSPNIGNKTDINLIFYIIVLIIGSILLYYWFKMLFHVGNTLKEAATQTIRVALNPKKLIKDLILGLIKSILIGIFYRYIYFLLPLTVLSFVIYRFYRKREFKKICQQIIGDIKKKLEDKMDKSMKENEIVDYYSKKYNIDKNTFLKKYLKELYELRKKDHTLKLSQNINSKGEKETIWELCY